MANTKYLRCERCGCDALPRKYNAQTGQLSETGTSTLMRCPDCCNKAESARGYATMCRECCPTGHGTHGLLTTFDRTDFYFPDELKAFEPHHVVFARFGNKWYSSGAQNGVGQVLIGKEQEPLADPGKVFKFYRDNGAKEKESTR